MSKKIDKYLNEAVANIREDRDVTKELLDDILKVTQRRGCNCVKICRNITTLKRTIS
jgi:hypothetical protein